MARMTARIALAVGGAGGWVGGKTPQKRFCGVFFVSDGPRAIRDARGALGRFWTAVSRGTQVLGQACHGRFAGLSLPLACLAAGVGGL